jgi:hypothetical protein
MLSPTEHQQTLREWFDEHTQCGFDEIEFTDEQGGDLIVREYFNGTYQICLTDSDHDHIWLANGHDSVGCLRDELADVFGEHDAADIIDRLKLCP